MEYFLYIATTAAIFAMLALSLDLIVGVAGMMSLASAAFFGVGAYATALLMKLGMPPVACQLIGMGVAALLSMAIAIPAIRVRGIYLLIISIAVQVVFTVVLQNWVTLTGGDAGISNIAPYSLFGYVLQGWKFTLFVCAASAGCFLLLLRLAGSPFGRVLQALRDDETGAAALGKDVAGSKLAAYALSSALAAFAGSLYAHYSAYIDPLSFDISVSIVALLMVMLGGAGTLTGPILGAVVLTLLPEALKFLPLPPGSAAPARQLVYGALLVLVVFFRPQGLLGRAHVARRSH
jgi:branched-chain amino acid transport system permease protein